MFDKIHVTVKKVGEDSKYAPRKSFLTDPVSRCVLCHNLQVYISLDLH